MGSNCKQRLRVCSPCSHLKYGRCGSRDHRGREGTGWRGQGGGDGERKLVAHETRTSLKAFIPGTTSRAKMERESTNSGDSGH